MAFDLKAGLLPCLLIRQLTHTALYVTQQRDPPKEQSYACIKPHGPYWGFELSLFA